MELMDAYSHFSDSELAKLLLRKDKAALEQVYLRYWNPLFHHAGRMLNNPAEAEDLVHDLFVHLIDKVEHLHITGPLDAYLYQAVRHRVINHFHKDKNRRRYAASLQAFVDQGEFGTDEQVLARDMKKRIEDTVSTFPPKMREVYDMSRNQFLTRREIAKATGTGEKTVDTQLTRALKILRSRLYGWFF